MQHEMKQASENAASSHKEQAVKIRELKEAVRNGKAELAAALALAWLTAGGMLRTNAGGGESQVAGWTPGTADEAYEQYQMVGLAEGRVLGELPKVMIQVERLENGQAEVTYLRRVLERRLVTDVLEPTVDTQGRPALKPAQLEEDGDETAL